MRSDLLAGKSIVISLSLSMPKLPANLGFNSEPWQRFLLEAFCSDLKMMPSRVATGAALSFSKAQDALNMNGLHSLQLLH